MSISELESRNLSCINIVFKSSVVKMFRCVDCSMGCCEGANKAGELIVGMQTLCLRSHALENKKKELGIRAKRKTHLLHY